MTASIHATILRVALAAALVAAPCFAQPALAQEGENADQIMAQLKSRAAAEQKNILLSFSASWCVNCRLFDGFLADRAIHPILDRVFVIGDMTAGEHAGDNRHTNTPGAEKLTSALGGQDAGYPFIVMLDANGNLIVNSLRPTGAGSGDNIGYPDAPYEIDWFMEMLKKAAPSLTAVETSKIRRWLKAHSSAH
jgi:hypothetical protein